MSYKAYIQQDFEFRDPNTVVGVSGSLYIASRSAGDALPSVASAGISANGVNGVVAVYDGSSTVDGLDITTFTSGPLSTFNQHGNGASGSGGNRCSGDNCNVGGADGADSYSGNVAGGTGGDAGNGGPYESGQVGNPGTRGSGGGGGGTEQGAPGGAGGDGEINYRFMRIA